MQLIGVSKNLAGGYTGAVLDHDALLEIRRENLRQLAASQPGGHAAFAERLGRSPGQLSHLIGKNPTKPIGEKLAREFEEKLGQERYWLDRVHGINDKLFEQVMAEIDGIPRTANLSPAQKRRLIALTYALVAEHGVQRERIRELIDLFKEAGKA